MNILSLSIAQLGPYAIENMLDKGGMALVYKALDQRTDTVVALKVLYPYLLCDADMVKRFQREAGIIQSLDHPHIVKLVDFGEWDGYFYLAMRYMTGGNLENYLQSGQPFEVDKSLKLLWQIASALDYAHANNIIHRDLKSENILLDANGDWALADFGIARVVGGTHHTVTGQISGTPHYMSPDHVLDSSNITYRADLYSFAVLAYRLCVGRLPFDGHDPLAILHQHLTATPPAPSSINPALSKEVDAVLAQGMEKCPEERFSSAKEFVGILESVLVSSRVRAAYPLVFPAEVQSTLTAITDQDIPTIMLNVTRPKSKRRHNLWRAFALLIASALLITSWSLYLLMASTPPISPAVSSIDNEEQPIGTVRISANPVNTRPPETLANITYLNLTAASRQILSPTPYPTSVPPTPTLITPSPEPLLSPTPYPTSVPPTSTLITPSPEPLAALPEVPITEIIPSVQDSVPPVLNAVP